LPPRRSKLTTGNYSDDSENQAIAQIGMVFEIFSKMIPTITKFTRETMCKLEENIMTFKNSKESANVSDWTYFTEVTKELFATHLRRVYKREKLIFKKIKLADYESLDRAFFFKVLK